MKAIILLLALAATAPSLWANAGAGPWANGAYYPGQLDGRYSANVYNNTQAMLPFGEMDTPTNIVRANAGGVVSGVLGFGIRNGTPSVDSTQANTDGTENNSSAGNSGTGSGTATDSGNSVQSIELDTSHNYFVIYVDGDVYAGQTAAGINLSTKKVAGSLWRGTGRNSYLVTNTTAVIGTNIIGEPLYATNPLILSIPGASANGYFNAKIKSDKSPFTFKGPGEITVRPTNAQAILNYPFKLTGIKSTDNSISGYSQTGRSAP